MSVDMTRHFVTLYITKTYIFMSIGKVDKNGQKIDRFWFESFHGPFEGFDIRSKDSRTAITRGSFIDQARFSSKLI